MKPSINSRALLAFFLFWVSLIVSFLSHTYILRNLLPRDVAVVVLATNLTNIVSIIFSAHHLGVLSKINSEELSLNRSPLSISVKQLLPALFLVGTIFYIASTKFTETASFSLLFAFFYSSISIPFILEMSIKNAIIQVKFDVNFVQVISLTIAFTQLLSILLLITNNKNYATTLLVINFCIYSISTLVVGKIIGAADIDLTLTRKLISRSWPFLLFWIITISDLIYINLKFDEITTANYLGASAFGKLTLLISQSIITFRIKKYLTISNWLLLKEELKKFSWSITAISFLLIILFTIIPNKTFIAIFGRNYDNYKAFAISQILSMIPWSCIMFLFQIMFLRNEFLLLGKILTLAMLLLGALYWVGNGSSYSGAAILGGVGWVTLIPLVARTRYHYLKG
jgi:O-antigen/teichoic acid export membrane protein